MAQPQQDLGGEQSSPVKAESDGLDRTVEVSAVTLRTLEYIAGRLDCTVNAALEEVIREFNPTAPRLAYIPDLSEEADRG